VIDSRKCEAIFDVDNRAVILEDLEKLALAPDFWSDQNKAKTVIDKTNQQRAVLRPFNKFNSAVEDIDILMELCDEDPDGDDGEMSAEIEDSVVEAEKLCKDLEFQAMLSGPLDANNAFLTIHAGAGGTESCDWADMLLRMYKRYCETHDFKLEVLDYQAGDEAGIKSATVLVSGPHAYGYIRSERGVHRLVRISPFDSNSRRHTSFAALDIVAEVDDVDVDIEDADIRIDTYRASGAGGQHVNTTDSAVRLTHTPTSIVVSCQA
jgi:peptide chain release factor 2